MVILLNSFMMLLKIIIREEHITNRENPSSSAGFDASSSGRCGATSKALQLTLSSSVVRTRATTTDYISSAFMEGATIC